MTDLSPFPVPFSTVDYFGVVREPRTVRELEMMRCSAHIREKPEWFVKRNDEEIVARWTRARCWTWYTPRCSASSEG